MIVVEGVVKRYGGVTALDGVDLSAPQGEVVALLGPSGCGKSTLLRLVAGLEQPDAGTVRVAGRPVPGPGPDRGMVDQAGTLFPWLTLRDNLAWGPRAARRTDALAVADALLAETGLDGFADALPHQLSGGMRQRGAIAQVLANRPPVLLLDEPFGALDAQTRILMHEWLRGVLATSPATVLLVTHDVEEALLLADRLVLLSARPGRVVERLPVDLGERRDRHTYADPRFVALRRRVLDLVLPV